MNNFQDILLPEFISVHLKGGPSFATSCASTVSGREIRVLEREYAVQKYTLTGARLSMDQFHEFNCFFRSRKGMYHSFRMRDHADFKLEHQLVAAHSDETFNYEIFKKYEDNISSYFRRITTLRSSTVKSNMAYEAIDYIRGIIFLDSLLLKGQTLIISAEFDVAVRFCSDEFKYSFSQDGSVIIDELELQEVLI